MDSLAAGCATMPTGSGTMSVAMNFALKKPSMIPSKTLIVCKPLSGHPPAELTFRIHGGGKHGQIVRVTDQRCMVGSAAECSLRFEDPGVRPRHCLILRG